MKIRLMACGFVLGIAAALLTSQALSQQGGSGGGGGQASDGRKPEMPMPSPEEMQAMMKAWEEAMMPGEPHKNLMKTAGNWDTVTKMWMEGPNAPPTEVKGTAEMKAVLGGRFVMQEQHAQFPMPGGQNMPWDGIGMFGYDNFQKMYVGCWADSMGTQLLTMRGNLSQDGKTLTMYGEMDEPMLGVRGRMVKYVTDIASDDKQIFSIYDLHAGDDYKVVEVIYTRKK